MKVICQCFFAVAICSLSESVLAEHLLSPGDQVVAIRDVQLLVDGKSVGSLGRGTPLTVQTVEGPRIRVRGQRPGWIDAASVIPKAKAREHFRDLLNTETDDTQELFVRAMVCIALNEYDSAIADFTKCIQGKPLATAYAERGYCWMMKDDKRKALADYNAALQLAPENPVVLANRGLIHETMGDLPKAIADYDAAISLNPAALKALQHRGSIRIQQGEYQKAVADFTSAINADPQCVDCFVNRGRSWIKSGQPYSAIDDYTKALSLNDTAISALFNRGLAWESQQQPEKAIADYSRVLRVQPRNAVTLYHRGYLQLMQGKADAALADFNAALEIDPGNLHMLRQRAHSLFRLDRFEEAIADHSVILQKNPRDTLALVDRGMCYKELDKPDEAITDFTVSLEIDANHPMAYWACYARAELKRTTGQFRDAVFDYNSALARSYDPNALHGRGSCMRNLGRIKDAIADFRAVVTADPNHWIAMNDLAWALATWPDDSIRNGEEAVELATKACEVNEWKHPLLLDTLSAAYAESGDFLSAVKYLKKARESLAPAKAKEIDLDHKLTLYEAGQPFRETPVAQGHIYLPGDRVIAVRDADLLLDSKKSGRIARATVLVVQAIDENKVRFRNEGAGWVDSSVVVPLHEAAAYFTKLIGENPSNAADLTARGRVMSALGEYDKAIEDFNIALSQQPNADAYYQRGYCRMRKDEPEIAVTDFSRAIELAPNSSEYHASRGIAYHILKDEEKALADYDAAISLNPRQLSALQYRGYIRMDRDAHTEAIKDFTAAIGVDPTCIDCFINRGRSHVISGTPDKGIEDYSRAIDLNATSVGALFNRGAVYQDLGKRLEALADFNRLLQIQPDNVGALHRRGQVHLLGADYAAAEKDFRAALQQNPEDRFILRDLARTLTDLGRYDDAIKMADKVLAKHPDEAVALLFRGVALQSLGKPAEALTDINAAFATGDLSVGMAEFAHYRKASLHQQAAEYDKAIAEYGKATERVKDPFALYGRAVCYAEMKEPTLAVDDFRASIAAKPDFEPACNRLAWILGTWPDATVRDGDEAVKFARQACELTEWKDGNAIDTLAAAYAASGDFKTAVRFQKQAIELMQSGSTEAQTERLKLYESGKPFRMDLSKRKAAVYEFPGTS